MNQLQIHAEGTPDESFLVPISVQEALFSRGYLCRQCPYVAVEEGGPYRCKSQCAHREPGEAKVLIHKKHWTPEVDAKFLKLRLRGEV